MTDQMFDDDTVVLGGEEFPIEVAEDFDEGTDAGDENDFVEDFDEGQVGDYWYDDEDPIVWFDIEDDEEEPKA